MGRASAIAILALLASGVAACTNSPEDFGGGSSETVRARRPGASNTASGEIEGEAQTPSEEPLSGSDPATGNANGNEDDGADLPAADPDPAPDPDPGADPAPDPNPAPDPIPAGSFAAETSLVTTANLNIRDGADTSSAILTTVPKGSTVIVQTVSGSNGWVNVAYGGFVGWSSKSYLASP